MTLQNIDRLKDAVDRHIQHAVNIRRRLHRFPEPGFKETRTSALVAQELRALGLAPHLVSHTTIVTEIYTTSNVARSYNAIFGIE